MNDFTIHACEQSLRFTRVENWDDLSEELKIQLGFNVGAMALGLSLSKEDGFLVLKNARENIISMGEFHEHLKKLIQKYEIPVQEINVNRPF